MVLPAVSNTPKHPTHHVWQLAGGSSKSGSCIDASAGKHRPALLTKVRCSALPLLRRHCICTTIGGAVVAVTSMNCAPIHFMRLIVATPRLKVANCHIHPAQRIVLFAVVQAACTALCVAFYLGNCARTLSGNTYPIVNIENILCDDPHWIKANGR